MKQNAHPDKAGNKMEKADALHHEAVSGVGAPEEIVTNCAIGLSNQAFDC
jgi:hypothetical protein